MHDVSNAINILDGTKGVDKAICKDAYRKADWASDFKETAGKCGLYKSSGGTDGAKGGLSLLFNASSNTAEGGNYDKDQAGKMGEHTSTTISTDITALNREQHGVVSSAFAKAHEGA